MKIGELVAYLRLDKTGYSSGIKSAQTEATAFSQFTDKTFAKIGMLIKRGMLAGGAAIVKATADAKKFNEQMANISTMLSQETLPMMDEFSDGILNMVESFGESTDKMTKGLYDILSAGIDAGSALDVLEVSAMTARAGLTDVGTAADALTTLMNAFGDSTKDAQYYSDLMFATVKFGKTTMDQLAGAIGGVATMAGQMGVTMEEVSGALSILTRKGNSTDIAVTLLRATMTSLLNPTEQAAETAKELGIEFGMAAIEAKGFAGLMDSLSGLAPEQLAKLFPNVRALRGVMGIVGEMGIELQKINDLYAEGSPMLVAYEKQTKEFAFTWDRFKSTLKVLSITIGQEVIPKVQTLIASITQWISLNKDNIAAFVRDFITKIGDLLTWLWKWRDVLVGVGAALGTLMVANKAATAIQAFGTAIKAMTGPVGWISIAIGALVAGFVALRRAIREAKEEQQLIQDAIDGTLTSVEDYEAAAEALERRNQRNLDIEREHAETLKESETRYNAARKALELMADGITRSEKSTLRANLALLGFDETTMDLVDSGQWLVEVQGNLNRILDAEQQNMATIGPLLQSNAEARDNLAKIEENLLKLKEDMAKAEEDEKKALQEQMDAQMDALKQAEELVLANQKELDEKNKLIQAEQLRKTAIEEVINAVNEARMSTEELAEAERARLRELGIAEDVITDWITMKYPELKKSEIKTDELTELEKKALREEFDGLREKSIEEQIALIEKQAKAYIEAGNDALQVEKWRAAQVKAIRDKEVKEDEKRNDEIYAALTELYEEKTRLMEEERDRRIDILEEWDRLRERSVQEEIDDVKRRGGEYLRAGADLIAVQKWVASEIKRINEDAAEETESAWKDAIDKIKDSLIRLIATEFVDAFRDMGDAMAEGQLTGDKLKDTISDIGKAILDALPGMLLQAGLQLIGTNLPLALILIAASGLVAGISGAVSGGEDVDVGGDPSDQSGVTYDDEGDVESDTRTEAQKAYANLAPPHKAYVDALYDALEMRDSGAKRGDVRRFLKTAIAQVNDEFGTNFGRPAVGRIDDAIAQMLGMIDGGLVGLPKFASGGYFGGVGGIDTNLAALTSGEYVMPPKQTSENLDVLESMRTGGSLTIEPVMAAVIMDEKVIGEILIDFMGTESGNGNLQIHPRAVRADS